MVRHLVGTPRQVIVRLSAAAVEICRGRGSNKMYPLPNMDSVEPSPSQRDKKNSGQGAINPHHSNYESTVRPDEHGLHASSSPSSVDGSS